MGNMMSNMMKMLGQSGGNNPMASMMKNLMGGGNNPLLNQSNNNNNNKNIINSNWEQELKTNNERKQWEENDVTNRIRGYKAGGKPPTRLPLGGLVERYKSE